MTSRSQHIDGYVERLRRLPIEYTGDLSMSRVHDEVARDAERFGIEPVAAFGAVVGAWENAVRAPRLWHLPSVRTALRSNFGIPLTSLTDLDLGYILVPPDWQRVRSRVTEHVFFWGSPHQSGRCVQLRDPIRSMLLTQIHLEGPEREKLLCELEDWMAQC